MKAIKKLSKLAAAGILMTAFALNFNACTNESPSGPIGDSEQQADFEILAKNADKAKDGDLYPLSGSVTFKYDRKLKGYKEGGIKLSDDSKLTILKNSLTAPPGTPLGAQVTITMQVERDTIKNELLYSYGPSWLSLQSAGGTGIKMGKNGSSHSHALLYR